MSFTRVIPKLIEQKQSAKMNGDFKENTKDSLRNLSLWVKSFTQYLTNLITDLERDSKQNLEFVSSSVAVTIPNTDVWTTVGTVNFTNTGLLVQVNVSVKIRNTAGSPTTQDIDVRVIATPNGDSALDRTIITYTDEQDISEARLISFHEFDSLATDTDRTAYVLQCRSGSGDTIEAFSHVLSIEERRTRV